MNYKNIDIQTDDGCILKASWYMGSKKQVIIIGSGMAVPRMFYRGFAQMLQNLGLHVFLLDYRGIGDSFWQPHFKGKLKMSDWGKFDITALIKFAKRNISAAQCIFLGHSSGGHTIGLSPTIKDLTALVFVASQSGYWGHWQQQGQFCQRWQGKKAAFYMRLTWHGVNFLAALPIERMPYHLINFSQVKVAASVAQEQSKWGLNPEYLFAAKFNLPTAAYARFNQPILSISFANDKYAPKAAVDAYMQHFSSAQLQRVHLDHPEINHFSVFKSQLGRQYLLRQITEFLL